MKRIIATIVVILLCTTTFAQLKTTREDRAYWNGFVDYLEAKGLKGSKDLDSRKLNLGQKLFDAYNKLNNKNIDYHNFVTLVQTDIIEYRNQALAQIKLSIERHKLNPRYPIKFAGSEEEFMSGLSSVDGFAGQHTTSWKFPKEGIVGVNMGNDLYASNR